MKVAVPFFQVKKSQKSLAELSQPFTKMNSSSENKSMSLSEQLGEDACRMLREVAPSGGWGREENLQQRTNIELIHLKMCEASTLKWPATATINDVVEMLPFPVDRWVPSVLMCGEFSVDSPEQPLLSEHIEFAKHLIDSFQKEDDARAEKSMIDEDDPLFVEWEKKEEAEMIAALLSKD